MAERSSGGGGYYPIAILDISCHTELPMQHFRAYHTAETTNACADIADTDVAWSTCRAARWSGSRTWFDLFDGGQGQWGRIREYFWSGKYAPAPCAARTGGGTEAIFKSGGLSSSSVYTAWLLLSSQCSTPGDATRSPYARHTRSIAAGHADAQVRSVHEAAGGTRWPK